MSRLSIEEWQRKKWYLARKLFQDEPTLSPIPELREPHTRSDSTESLPELNVEVVPKRKDVDESDEFYQELEKTMKEIISSDQRGYNASITGGIDKEPVELNAIEENSSPETYAIQCLYNSDNVIMERSSGAHSREDNEELSVIDENDTSGSNKSRSSNSDARDYQGCQGDIIPAVSSPVRSRSPSNEFHKLASTEDASENKSNGDPLSYPDIMRKNKRTLRTTDVYKHLSEHSSTGYPNSLSFAASELSMYSSNASEVSVEPLMCSTPKILLSEKGKKRKHISNASSSKVKKSKTAQTSFSDNDENYCSNFWNNLFVGKPIIYNLCSCNNHICV